MKRRRALALVTVLLGGFVGKPSAARAQQPAKAPLVGFLGAESPAAYERHVAALRAGLRDAGYVEGRNLRIEFRWAEGKYARLPQLAEELARLKVDVLVTHGAPATGAAKRATRTIPIVMARAGDAVATDLVPSLARPGGNVTGLTFFAPEIGAKRLDLLREVLPRATRVAHLSVPGNPISAPVLYALEQAAKPLKLALHRFDVREPADLEATFGEISKTSRIDAVLIPEYSMFIANAEKIAALAAKHHLPAIGYEDFAEAGGLIGYGANAYEMYRRSAAFVDKILKGANPGDLPVERATTFELIVNLKTAKALGISIPPAVLVRADRVIQ